MEDSTCTCTCASREQLCCNASLSGRCHFLISSSENAGQFYVLYTKVVPKRKHNKKLYRASSKMKVGQSVQTHTQTPVPLGLPIKYQCLMLEMMFVRSHPQHAVCCHDQQPVFACH